jgi:DUF1365 family protein
VTAAPVLYSGVVTHLRRRPREHRLVYRIYSLLLDLDRLEATAKGLKFLSLDRFNLFSFYSRDRGDRSGRPLRQQVEATLRAAGLETDGGAILLLTMPRVLGFAFNPLSVFYCHDKSGRLTAILWEVDNTFGERHAYLIPVEADPTGVEIRQSCAKDFFVSPFMDMKLSYAFRFNAPDDLLRLVIDVSDDKGSLLVARYQAHRQALTDANLLRLFFSLPLLPLRVVGGINWEAVKLLSKGVRWRRKPPPPEQTITFVRSPAASSAP